MLLFRNKTIVFFFLVLTAHCLFILFDAPVFRGLTKALIIPPLLVYLWKNVGRKAHWLVYAGLFLAFTGDMLLLGPGDLFFMGGMLAFVCAHVFTSLYFLQITDHDHIRLREAFVAAIILMALSITLFIILNEHLDNFRVPVLVYMLVISIMTILAAHAAGNPVLRKIAWNCFIPGAALFVISDANLALNKFLIHEPFLDIITMVFYALAEYYFVRGVIGVTGINASPKKV